MEKQLSRREFLATTGAAAAIATTTSVAAAKRQAAPAKPHVCIFSKHLQFMNYKELAKACTDLGLDGVDLPVRTGGHVLPENVEQDLPRAVDAVRSEGHDVQMITTRLPVRDVAYARPILQKASELGIRYFRVGGQKYTWNVHPAEELKKFTEELRTLVPLAEQYDMVAVYHIHSGERDVGGSIWDLYQMIKTIDSERIRVNYDLGHVPAEGTKGAWMTSAHLLAPYVRTMATKDFVYEGKEFRWVPIGEGMAPLAEQLAIIREAGFAGPVSMHFEYDLESNDVLLEHIRQAADTMRAKFKEAGYV